MDEYLHKVRFAIFGMESPEAITERLGVTPNVVRKKGETQTTGKLKREVKESMWILELSDNDENGQYEALLAEVLKKLEPVEAELAKLTKQYYTEISFLGYATYAHAAGIHLDTDTIQKLASLNIALDIDIYYIGSNDE